jgi:REP element-mobilizing transposase RayT
MRAGRPRSQEGPPGHKEWYSRGYLPHFDHPHLVQIITFRLADSLPLHVLTSWQQAYPDEDDAAKRRRLERYLDAGHGSCSLEVPQIGRLVEDALLHFDGVRYRLLAWVVMPNHVHVLVEAMDGHRLPDIVHAWKSFTAKEANKILGRSGEFWQPEYYDRYIRDADHFDNALHYIHANPVRAGLVAQPEDWAFSSAGRAGSARSRE